MKLQRSTLLLALLFAEASTFAETAPNVVIILADDLGWADIGIQNEEATKDVTTPNIDKIFASGLRITNGYVANATCGPSRPSLLTRRSSSRFGMEDNIESSVLVSEVMIPQIIGQAGYTSGIIGKWHLGDRNGQLPLDKGFDEFYGFLGGNHNYCSNAKPVMSGSRESSFDGYLTDA